MRILSPVRSLFTPFFSLFFMLSFAFPAVSAAEGPLSVFVSILPQKHFVERIGGDRVSVEVMVAPGASPATYEPRPRQMAGISTARLYFAVGVPFESVWLDRIAAANPAMKIVRIQDGIEKRAMAAHRHHPEDSEEEHRHGHDAPKRERETHHSDRGDHDHGHGETPPAARHDHRAHETGGIRDPHIWLSPPLVIRQARNILDALVAEDPAGRAHYAARYRDFVAEIVELDLELMEILSKRETRSRFMVYHPSWGYFADTYGLTQIPAEIEGKEPKPAQLQALIERARREGVSVIFVQPQFSRRSAETIAQAIDGEVVEVDPLAENWADNLRAAAKHFVRAVR
jgi:zinc transport system substrate-binding protein